MTETASASDGQECRRTKGEPRALRGVGLGNSPTVLSVRGRASTSGNGGAEKRRGWSSIRSDGGVTWGGELADDGEPRGSLSSPDEEDNKRLAMGDAGTPRGRSRTEDGGPSTQRGEPFGEDGDGDRSGGLGQAWPQAPDVVILIGSEAGSAAAFTATAALIKSSSFPGEAGGDTTRPTKRGLAPLERPSFTAKSARSLARVTQTAKRPLVAAALPPGAEDGDELVVKERGMPSSKDGERGDLRVRVVVS